MDFTAFNQRMIADSPITRYMAADLNYGYEFKLRYPTYRGTWLSCIKDLTIRVDGRPVSPGCMLLGLNGKWFQIHEISDLSHEYWFTTQAADMRVIQKGGLAPGEHKVSVRMVHTIPYTGYFGNHLVIDSTCEKVLTAI